MESITEEAKIPTYFNDFIAKDVKKNSLESLVKDLIVLYFVENKKASTQINVFTKLNNFIQKPYLINNNNYLLFHLKVLATLNVFDTEYQMSLRKPLCHNSVMISRQGGWSRYRLMEDSSGRE